MAQSMNDSVLGVERIIGYKFENPALLWEALQAPGSNVSQAGNRLISIEGNKRMAILGDKWMDFVIITDWFIENLPRVEATNRLQSIATNENLQRVFNHHKLHRFVNNNRAQRGLVSPSIKTSTVEAIIGAGGLDGGVEAVRLVMQNLGLLAPSST